MRTFYFDLLSRIAFAHGAHSHEATAAFAFKLPWDPTLLFFIIVAWLYARGLQQYGDRAPVNPLQKRLFFLGIAVLCGAYLPPIDTISDQLFSMHMTQHLLITVVGIPLITLGVPWMICPRGMSMTARRIFILPFVQTRTIRRLLRQIRRPLMSVFLYEATMWFWHVPYFYNHALLNDAIHWLEHGCMALAAINLWRVLIQAGPIRNPISAPLRIALLGLMMTMDMGLSAALTYSTRVWYAYDQLPSPQWWTSDRLSDQQLGGLIMWVPGSAVWLTALIMIFYFWTQQELTRKEVVLPAMA